MSYRGIVKNGVVVLPPGTNLQEGAAVEVVPQEIKPEDDPFLARVLKVRKPRPHWPKDYARDIDQYLYGVRRGL